MTSEENRGAGRSRAHGRKPAQKKAERELTTKRRGELSELAFVYKAASEGFAVAKPYGDSQRYDFIVDNGHRLWRVQIKSTTQQLDGLYHINAGRHTNGEVVPYQPHEIDFLAAHIIPEDTWFLIPISILDDRISILLAPRDYPRGPGVYGDYREAWHLLRE
jgi:hypothetical protein